MNTQPATMATSTSTSTSTPPSAFVCPITAIVMEKPVIGCEQGHVFDEKPLQQWRAAGHNSCPTCRGNLMPHFIPDRHLAEEIKLYLANGGVTTAADPSAGSRAPFKDSPVTFTASVFEESGQTILNVRVETDPHAPRQGTDYIIAADNSGSMDTLIDPDSNESLFTRMDLLYHTINTAAAMMTEKDTLTLVSFSQNAKIAMETTTMNAGGKSYLASVLPTIKPEGSTNIYEAVTLMMSIANRPQMAGRNVVAALLTDGEETAGTPPSGTVPALRRAVMKNPWNFSTFGFGYQLKSSFLAQLAELGGGIFGFIPDVTMVGTVFINFIATAAVTGTRNAQITYTMNGNSTTVDTGVLAAGHARDFYFPVSRAAAITVSVNGSPAVAPAGDTSEFAKAKRVYADILSTAIQFASMNKAARAGDALAVLTDRFAATTCEKTKKLLLDVASADSSEGQIGMAPGFWSRWGEHYSRSYLRTVLQCERPLNFKDPGSLIMRGGALFETILGQGEDAFVSLVPPVPSGQKAGLSQQQVATIRNNTAAYMSYASSAAYNGGCFAGTTRIRMGDGSRKPISEIRPGDIVWTMGGNRKVEVFVTCGSKNPLQMMSKVQGKDGLCLLTPFHPYMTVNGKWVTGRDTVGDEPMDISTVYNLVLEKRPRSSTEGGHIVDMEGVFCCTLAHGMRGDVIEHDFFGSEKVIECMKTMPNYPCPVYTNLEVTRDPVTGLINGWVEAP